MTAAQMPASVASPLKLNVRMSTTSGMIDRKKIISSLEGASGQ